MIRFDLIGYSPGIEYKEWEDYLWNGTLSEGAIDGFHIKKKNMTITRSGLKAISVR